MINHDQYTWLELDSIPETTSNIFLDDHYGVMHDPVEEFTSVLLDPQYIHFVCKEILNVELLPFQLAIIDRFWHKRLPMLIGCRGAGKSFVLAVYSLLKLLLNPGCKVVLVGSSFRQSKQIHDYIVSIWDKAPILQDIAGKNSGPKKSVDRYEFFIGSSVATALPIGDGSKIRGIRANIIIADEFASISEEIFNVVIQGFAIVSSTPVEKVKEEALINKLKNSGLWTEELEDQHKNKNRGNQIIYSGTAYYAFNHFYKYFQKWREIITSNGDQAKLSSVVDSNDPLSDGFNWKDYCIVRLPYTALPKGLLDSGILAQAKATLNTSQFLCEYSAVFPKDSDGFYRRSIIDAATTTKPINIADGRKIQFSVMKTGDPKKKYILGIDPAAERDNAALVILEDNGIYRSVVHCWTTNRKKFFALKNKSKESDIEITDDYYRYIAKKVRQLMRDFNISRICMDKNGGGVAIAEALSSKDTCMPDENPVFELIDPEKPKFSDAEKGVHILELISPTTDINSQANHGMLKDIQDKVLLFPRFDTVEIEKGMILDNMEPENTFSSYEDLINEIEELKNEMTSIVMTGTSMLGAEKFDTPEVKLEGAKKGRLKKDRYSALLYANYFGRNQNKQEASLVSYASIGGITPSKTTGNGMYRGFGVAKFGQSDWTKSGNPRFIKREQ